MDVLSRTPPTADHRLPYGALPLQFGDLWLPKAGSAKLPLGGKAPVLVFVHGGWWQSAYDLAYAGFLCRAFRDLGLAVWSLEYRRVGDAGGGWPGTFQDVAAGFDFLPKLAEAYPLDLTNVVAAGHSAGGQLAFWLGGRHHVPESSVLYTPQPAVPLRSAVALAGAVDLRLTIDLSGIFEFHNGKPAVLALMGGSPAQVPERYRAANPGDLLPLNIPQFLVQGTADNQIPPALPSRWAENARRQGDPVEVTMIPGADHFDVVDPESTAWGTVKRVVLSSFGRRS